MTVLIAVGFVVATEGEFFFFYLRTNVYNLVGLININNLISFWRGLSRQ